MAKITEQKISITMSKLVRDGESSSNLIQPDVVSTLEQVVQELVGSTLPHYKVLASVGS